MNKMKIQSAKPFFEKEYIPYILEDIKNSLKSGILTKGPKIEEFEKKFAEYIGTKYAISVNSGTSALDIILRFFDVRKKEIIVPTNACVACANAIIFAGGKPILADTNPETLCMGPEDIIKKINPRTKGVILVHLAGLISPQIGEIKKICKENNLFLIEDAAQAHGATINGKKAGSLSSVGCFSFYPTKIMTTGEGGMITTNNQKLAEFAKKFRNHGISKDELHHEIGHNLRMGEINAILGIYQLKGLKNNIERRKEIVKKYEKKLKIIKEISFIKIPQNIEHSYYKYPILINNKLTAQELTKIMKEKYNIQLGTLYDPPIHLQPAYKKKYGYKEGMLSKTEEMVKKQICLPLFMEITDEQINYIINALKQEL
mgnify:CR=1 FL=1|jgi:perosamine synthetase